MDLVDYVAGRLRRGSSQEYRAFAAEIGIDDVTLHPAVGADAATTSPTPSERDALVRRPDADRATSRRSRSTTSAAARAVPDAGAVGQPPEPRLPRLLRARSPAATVRAGRPRRRPALRPREHGRADRHLRRRPRRRPSPGQSVTLTLADEIDVSRGDVHRQRPTTGPRSPTSSRRPSSGWTTRPMLPGRPYLMKHRRAHRRRHDHRAEVQGQRQHARAAGGDAARAERDRRLQPLARPRRSPFDPYAENRDIGGFILIDRITNSTVGAGMLHFALRRSHNIHWQAIDVDKAARAPLEGPAAAACVWLTGPLRRGQVDDRQPRREAAARATAATPTCSTATTCATGSTRTSASPRPTASRTSAASARSPS